MTKINIEIEIEINPEEDSEAVLNSYFSHQSHVRGRKVVGFKILKSDPLAIARAAKAAKAAESKEEKESIAA